MPSDNHNFIFTSLQSKGPLTARKVHIRRLYDILQLCIQRQDYSRARQAWAILARCKEIQWMSLWITGLLLADPEKEKVDYLRSLMLRHPDDRGVILTELIHCLIISERYREALDELELYLPSFPYQDNPILHIYAALLLLYLSQDVVAEDIPHRSTLLREAQIHLERANELDKNNAMAQTFLQKVEALGRNLISQTNEANSDQEPMEVDEGLVPKPKRPRI
ncbi:hypothetical protein APHAL10511_001731 [Amanita phalloides]|nr:hypothetical protein APHAL10511_001731 [Amanita phalloides]